MAWWMSRSCVVENLLHAAAPHAASRRSARVYLLPVLHASHGRGRGRHREVHGEEVLERVTYQRMRSCKRSSRTCRRCGARRSLEAGFRHDGTLETLVQTSLDGP